MVNYLEKLLLEKSHGTPSSILYAQWSYDKRLVPSALQAVNSIFPHYSLHDESHSITIINNIVRILGKKNIELLSAIDIWLILEAAYNHDLGMVIPADRILDTINSDKFLSYFRDLCLDQTNSLHEFAMQFEIKNGQVLVKDSNFSFAQVEGFRYILAEYYRRYHGENSRDIIVNPLTTISLDSPRTIIPKRIFKVLAEISLAHTKDFDFVMNLPFSEVGVDVEDAHPRFIACLLRIGDLLDLDNNRFSEVMLRTLTAVPLDTLLHKSKHLSIERFRVDREIIEITARCQNYDVADITENWFKYLDSEITSQKLKWNYITPLKELGPLPMIGDLRVELNDYAFIDGKNKPRFSIDTSKALNLLQGVGLYEDSDQSIREVLQNSVDSTMIRIGCENDNLDLLTPGSYQYNEILKNYPIKVRINKRENIDQYQMYDIEIIDLGTGISSLDLTFLMTAGSSSKNKSRRALINKLPILFKPSGTFGIGFQSIFMLTDCVKIVTKSLFTNECQTIELYNPNSKRKGDVLLKKESSDYKRKIGCKLTFSVKLLERSYYPMSLSNRKNGQNQTKELLKNFDPFKFDSFEYEIAQILDSIILFSTKSPLPIELEFNGDVIPIKIEDGANFKYFDRQNFIEFSIVPNNFSERSVGYYKGQGFDSPISFEFLNFEYNIYGVDASEILTLSRNQVKKSYRSTLRNQLIQSVFRILTENFNQVFPTPDKEIIGSLFLHRYYNLPCVKDFNVQDFDQWKKYELNQGDADTEIQKLIDNFRVINVKIIRNDNRRYFTKKYGRDFIISPEEFYVSIVDNEIQLEIFSLSNDFLRFFLKKAIEKFKFLKTMTFADRSISNYSLTKDDVPNPFSSEMLLNFLIADSRTTLNTTRIIVPCPSEFPNLRLRSNSRKEYVENYSLLPGLNFPSYKMLLPYIKKVSDPSILSYEIDVNEKFFAWVLNNNLNPNIDLATIKEDYQKFITTFNLKKLNEVWGKRSFDFI